MLFSKGSLTLEDPAGFEAMHPTDCEALFSFKGGPNLLLGNKVFTTA